MDKIKTWDFGKIYRMISKNSHSIPVLITPIVRPFRPQTVQPIVRVRVKQRYD